MTSTPLFSSSLLLSFSLSWSTNKPSKILITWKGIKTDARFTGALLCTPFLQGKHLNRGGVAFLCLLWKQWYNPMTPYRPTRGSERRHDKQTACLCLHQAKGLLTEPTPDEITGVFTVGTICVRVCLRQTQTHGWNFAKTAVLTMVWKYSLVYFWACCLRNKGTAEQQWTDL